jgi:tetratricopeptide (TPR) repeat protein
MVDVSVVLAVKFCARKLLTLILFAAPTAALAGDDDRICAQAVQLHQSGDFAAAIRQYEACLALKPGSAELWSDLGAALAHEGRYQEAISNYRKALGIDPANPRLRYNLVLAYYKLGDIAQAVEELQPLHQKSPSDMQVNLLLADCYLRLGKMPEVIGLLSPFEAGHRAEPGFAYLLGMALIRSGDVARGEALVDQLLRDANSPEAHFLIANAAFSRQDYPAAVKEFARTVELYPGLPSVWSYYGRSLLFTGDAEGAADAFRKELAANPNDYEANVKLGSILAARKDHAAALPFLERALLLRPDSLEAHGELAVIYGTLGRGTDRDRELAVLEKAGVKPGTAPDSGLVPTGTPAPPFSLGAVDLAALVRKGPVALVFGSYSCPKFRFGAPALNALYDRYRRQVQFAMVYVAEAHAGGDWKSTINEREGIELQPAKSDGEKRAYADSCARKLHIEYPLAADGLDRKVEQAYHAWPSAVYLIARDGRVAWSSRLGELDFHAEEMEQAIQALLK